ncbi:MAG: AAA family ATPase [Muribaculaceae bacterium]|nr:AAA family ATPase [Muribaculaceae bacterium]
MSHFYTLSHGIWATNVQMEPICLDREVMMEEATISHQNKMFRFDAGYNCLKVQFSLMFRDIREFKVGRKSTSARLSLRLRLERGDVDDDDRQILATKDIVVPAPHASMSMTINTFMSLKEGMLTPGHYCLLVMDAADGAYVPEPEADFHIFNVSEEATELFRPVYGGFGLRLMYETPDRTFPAAPVEYHLARAGYYVGDDDDKDLFDEDSDLLEDPGMKMPDEIYRPRYAHFVVETEWEEAEEDTLNGTVRFIYVDGTSQERTVNAVLSEDGRDFGVMTARFTVEIPNENAPVGLVYAELRLFNEPVAGFVGEKTEAGTPPESGDFRGENLMPLSNTSIMEVMARLEAWKNECKQEVSTIEQLRRMVGLGDVKQKMESYITLIRFHKMRAQMGISSVMPPLHALFLGAPGTGKTTVAKLMGQLMREAGVLSRGHVVVRERSQIVGRHYGDESAAMRKAIEEAEGGVLFIDEAYTLYKEADPKDPGREAVETLLTALADSKKRNWMLILGGYEDKILKMFELNPGLASRFPNSNYYRFADYSASELLEIAEGFCRDNAFRLSAGAQKRLAAVLEEDVRTKDGSFGNARHVLNLLETEVFPAMAARVSGIEDLTEEVLTTIMAEDIPVPKQHTEPRRRLGFRA